MQYRRADRVADQILREISRMLHEEIKDPRIGMVTISRVQLTDDLRYARVFYSVYGDEAQRAATREGLKKATGFIKRQLGTYLRLRCVPEVTFKFDGSLDHVEKISTLLNSIKGPPSEVDAPDLEEDDGSDSEEDVLLEDEESDVDVDAVAFEEVEEPVITTERENDKER